MTRYDFAAAAELSERTIDVITRFVEASTASSQDDDMTRISSMEKKLRAVLVELDDLRPTFAVLYDQAQLEEAIFHDLIAEAIKVSSNVGAGCGRYGINNCGLWRFVPPASEFCIEVTNNEENEVVESALGMANPDQPGSIDRDLRLCRKVVDAAYALEYGELDRERKYTVPDSKSDENEVDPVPIDTDDLKFLESALELKADTKFVKSLAIFGRAFPTRKRTLDRTIRERLVKNKLLKTRRGGGCMLTPKGVQVVRDQCAHK